MFTKNNARGIIGYMDKGLRRLYTCGEPISVGCYNKSTVPKFPKREWERQVRYCTPTELLSTIPR